MSERPPLRVLVIGANGRLGCELAAGLEARQLPWQGTTRAEVDLASPEAAGLIERQARRCGANVLINAGAWTAVDAAEDDEAAALAVNAGGAEAVAEAARRLDARALHVSTDYVFDGSLRRPYREDDATAPLNAYGRTKLAGEQRFLRRLPQGLVVRTAWLFGRGGSGFPAAILRVVRERGSADVVDDEWGRPTSHADLAAALLHLLACPELAGIVHFCNQGVVSRFEQAREACRLAGLDPDVLRPVSRAQFGRAASRPAYSALDTSRYSAATGQQPPSWQDALRRALQA